MDGKGKQPSSWDDYVQGRRESFGSAGSRVRWNEREEQGRDSSENPPSSRYGSFLEPDLRRRRSSLSMRLSSFGDAGGPNSINNFARSWQRAAGFFEITSAPRSFSVFDDDEDEDEQAWVPDEENAPPHRPLPRAAIERGGQRIPERAIDDGVDETQALLPAPMERISSGERRSRREESIFSIEPSLASVFGGSYGTSYGSLSSRVNEPSMRHAARLFREQQRSGSAEPDKEREPMLVRQVEEDGKIVNVVIGRSTLPQTIFNSMNVLIGIGLLSLPLAFRYAGWLIGMIVLIFSALATNYTAKVLAKCLDVDNSLITFADLAYVSYGNRARILTSIIFILELLGACVAMVVLFADSLDALFPQWGTLTWKIVCGVIVIPIGFMPLRLLSFTSILGILSCLAIVVVVVIDGLIKPHQPGSLIEPAKQYLFPENWAAIPLSFGLIMAPWGGHSVFPNIYRDMRHPYKYRRGVNITYAFSSLLDLGMACAGILMFGDGVRDEVTANIFKTGGYPRILSIFIMICIGIIPITKIPLNARPLVSTAEVFLGLDNRVVAQTPTLAGMSGLNRGLLKVTIRVAIVALFVFIAVVLPDFDRIMTLLGSVAAFAVCIILPLLFHLKLFEDKLSAREKLINWILIILSIIMGSTSTVAACLPKELLGL